MDTKVSWPTVLGIAILGSIVVFALATLPMNDWLDHNPETEIASAHLQNQPPAEEKPFEFAPVQIAVGSSNKSPQLGPALTESENTLPNSNYQSIEIEPSFDSGLDAVAAQQAQADKLLEIAETLVFQNSVSGTNVAESDSKDEGELLALNPLAGVRVADLGPSNGELNSSPQIADTYQAQLPSGEPNQGVQTNSFENLANQPNVVADTQTEVDVLENGLALEGFDTTSETDTAPELDESKLENSPIELTPAASSDERVADATKQTPFDSPLSDVNTDLTPRQIAIDDPTPAVLAYDSEAASQSNRLKVQTVSQRKIKKPQSTSQHSVDDDAYQTYQAPSPGMIANPVRLLKELDEAKNDFPEITQWVISYKMAIGQLCNAQTTEQRRCLNQLEQLRQQLDFLIQKDQQDSQNAELSDLRQLCYSLDRRLDFWQATVPGNPILEARQQQQSVRMELIRSRRWNFTNVKITPQWSEYLMWPQLVRIVNDSTMPVTEKQTLAREILTRINSGRLDFQQEAVISQILPLDLQKQLYHHAGLKVDPTEVMAAIEAYEWKGDSLSAMRIMEGYRWLRLSEQVADQQIVQLIENHYRNANVRFTASREFINRWFVSQSWVNQTIAKQKENHVGIGVMPFQIDLIPSESGFHFQLNPAGQDDGTSEGWKSVSPPEENSQDQRGVISVSFNDQSDSRPWLTSRKDLGGNYQHIPLVDWIARRFPAGMTVGAKVIPIKHQVNSSSKLANELGQQLSQRMRNTESAIANTVRGFQLAGLSPKVIQNSSNVDSVVARFRIADNTQLASNTARPNPIPGALLSLQIHQTFINNALQRIEVAGQSFDWNSLGQHLADVCGLPLSTFQHQTAQLQNDQLQFADEQAIEVHFYNDQIQIVLNLDNARLGRLETGPIRLIGCFQSEIYGCNVSLVPAESTAWKIESAQLNSNQQEQIVTHLQQLETWQSLRITPTSWENDFLAKQLRISQFKLSNGWLSVSVESQPEEGSIALTQTTEAEVNTNRRTPNSRLIQAFLSDGQHPESPLRAVGPEMPILRSVLE